MCDTDAFHPQVRPAHSVMISFQICNKTHAHAGPVDVTHNS